ncbi:MAG TPA: hypothetical protein VF088_12775, partial [Pyrinomonadaceae bacterium]
DPAYPLDGFDLLPLLRDPRRATPRTLFWRNSNQSAALKDRWKYLNDGTQQYLFDLAVDERERADFSKKNPAMFEQLKTEYQRWESTVLPRPAPRERRND